MATYQSRPLFDFAPNWDAPRASLTDDVTFDQVAPGGIALPWVEADQPQALLRLQFLLDRDELKALEDFQDSVRGRLQGFWLPSWAMDYPLQEAAGSSATTLRVDRTGLADLFAEHGEQYAHLCIFLEEGATFPRLVPRKIAGVTGGDEHDTITLTTTIGETVPADARVSRLLYVRFADSRLRCRYLSPELVEVDIRFIELTREYAAAELGTRPVWLYRATRGSNEWTWAGYPVAIEAAGRTWTPAPISHGDVSFDTDFLQGDLVLTLATAAANHPFRSYLASPAIEPTRLYIYATEAPGFAVDLGAPFFEAEVGAPKYRPGGVVEAKLTTALVSGEWPMPRHNLQRLCNHLVYDPQTCRLAAGPLTVTAPITALGSKYIEAAAFGAEATARGDANWFALGDVTIGSEVRMVTSQSGNRLNLNAAFVAAKIGDTAVVRWGCDLLRATCAARGNLVNYGGYPDMPSSDPKLAAMEPPGSSGGKKG